MPSATLAASSANRIDLRGTSPDTVHEHPGFLGQSSQSSGAVPQSKWAKEMYYKLYLLNIDNRS